MMMAEMERRNHDNFNTGLVIDERVHSNKRQKTDAIIKKEKDKVGERMASLQQLVCPFGKTDTASVLEEATDYIRFLHDQLQVLSAPYLSHTGPRMVQDPEYYNLRDRGLCLVPVASTHGIASSNGADLWAPTNTSQRH